VQKAAELISGDLRSSYRGDLLFITASGLGIIRAGA
jgi:hypothetical protein